MSQVVLSPEIATPIIELAAHQALQGWSVFTCTADAGSFTAATFGDKTSNDLGPLIHSIEQVGWRLEQMSHVVIPKTGHDSRAFFILAHLMFRRASVPYDTNPEPTSLSPTG